MHVKLEGCTGLGMVLGKIGRCSAVIPEECGETACKIWGCTGFGRVLEKNLVILILGHFAIFFRERDKKFYA